MFDIDPKTHLLIPAQFISSPHCDNRPAETKIDLLVIHGISLPPGQFGGEAITDLFMGQINAQAHPYYEQIVGLRVSAHVLIRREGEVIQYVPFDKRAWHAGVSNFQGQNHCNDFSIGIELEGEDTVPYEPVQYQQLAHLTRVLMQFYPAITQKRIVGHSEVAPGRKTDPGPAFNWKLFFTLLSNI